MPDWRTSNDRWLRCFDGAWIRWSAVTSVELAIHSLGVDNDRHEIVLNQAGYRRIYLAAPTKEEAQRIIEGLFQKMDGDYA